MKSGLPRLKKMCKYGSYVMYTATAVLVCLALATLILGIVALFGNDTLYSWICIDKNSSDIVIISAFLGNILIWIIASITVFIIGLIMKSITSEHSPFTDKNARRMKTLAVTYLISSFLMLIFELLADKKPTEAVFIFMGLLLVAVVTYCLTLMCRYGTLLQQESDETL